MSFTKHIRMEHGLTGLIASHAIIISYKERNILKKVTTVPISITTFFMVIFAIQMIFKVFQSAIITIAVLVLDVFTKIFFLIDVWEKVIQPKIKIPTH